MPSREGPRPSVEELFQLARAISTNRSSLLASPAVTAIDILAPSPIFGPVAPVWSFESDEEALAAADTTDSRLVA